MKQIKHITFAALAGLMLASCSNDELQTPAQPAENLMSFQVGVQVPGSRANESQVHIDHFAISTFDDANPEYEYEDLKFIGDNVKGWNVDPSAGIVPQWKKMYQPTHFMAVYPRDLYDTGRQVTMPLINPQKEGDTNDVLLFEDPMFVPNDHMQEGRVHFSFRHAMSMIQVELSLPQGSTIDETTFSDVIVDNTVTIYYFHSYKDGSSESRIRTEEEIRNGIVPYLKERKGQTAIYRCVAVPQTLTNGYRLAVSFKYNGEQYRWTAPEGDLTLAPGVITRVCIEIPQDQQKALRALPLSTTPWKN